MSHLSLLVELPSWGDAAARGCDVLTTTHDGSGVEPTGMNGVGVKGGIFVDVLGRVGQAVSAAVVEVACMTHWALHGVACPSS